jgi:integrase/recombinase XerD
MLRSLFPKVHRKYLSMSVLGPVADGFDDWLAINGYAEGSRKHAMQMLRRVDADLRRRRVKEVACLTHRVLHDCWRTLIKTYFDQAVTVRRLERYLAANGLIRNGEPATATSRGSVLVEEYANYLREVRGLAASSVSFRRYTARCFLHHLDQKGVGLKKVQTSHIESYITRTAKRLSRASLSQDISALRGFLRFLSIDGRVPAGLTSQIDTPRRYRFEQLPRALPWEVVRALLRSVDRTSATGLRDYAVFLLIATYGLRASEVGSITLDDIHWRQRSLRIQQSKTSSSLELPLTNEVATALVKHLRRTPPPSPYRRIFLKMHAPIGPLNRSAIRAAFHSLVRKSGLRIPLQGVHCLRHSFAVHLLKNGTSLKTIGDILGHRSAESTSTYLRLATGDLREVPLPIPGREHQAKEGQR